MFDLTITLQENNVPQTVTGGYGDDEIVGGAMGDQLVDAGGTNTLSGNAGDDQIAAISGQNVLSGGADNDFLRGGYDNDSLYGGTGDDILQGDNSSFIGAADLLDGGADNDLLEGGIGADTFVFTTRDGNDIIGTIDLDYDNFANSTVTGPDFVSGVDTIQLEGFALADEAAAYAQVTDVNGVATFSAQGTTITFAGLTAADLSADDFILI